LLILSSYLVKIMFNYQIALGFFVLMGLEPFVLGNTRVIQTDILPAFLVFIAALLLYINKNKEGYYLYPLIGFILGISNIEKASTVIILPVFIFFILFNNKNNTKRFLKLSLFVLSFLVTMIICFPSFWGNFPFTFWRIFVGSFIQGVKGQDAETFTYTMTPHIRHWYFYLRFFYNQLSEFVVIGFFIGLFVELRKISNKKYKNLAKYLFLILIPIVFFIVFQISTKKVERFMLYIFPFIILYSSVALIKLTDRYKIYNWFILTVITVRIVQFIFIFPDFLIYKNTLSMDKRYSNSYTSWGVGFYKLAKYLESTYGTDKKIYSGDYQNLRLFYTGKVLDKEILDYDSSFDFIIKTNEPERNTSILDRVILDDVFSPYEDVRFYIYRRI